MNVISTAVIASGTALKQSPPLKAVRNQYYRVLRLEKILLQLLDENKNENFVEIIKRTISEETLNALIGTSHFVQLETARTEDFGKLKNFVEVKPSGRNFIDKSVLKIGVLRQCGYTMPPNYFGIDFILPMTIKRNGENPNVDDIFSFIAVQSKSTKQDLVECTFKMSGLFHLNRCPNTNHLNESHCTASNCKAYIKMSDMITILEDQVVILLTASSPKARSSTATVCLKGRQSKRLEKKKEEAENAKLASLKGNKSNMNNVSASGTKKSEPRVKKAKISQQPDEIVEDAFNSFNAEMLAFVPDMDRKNVISVNFPNYFSANKIRFDLQPECIITKNISDTVTLQKMIWDYSEDQIEFLLSDNSSKKGKKGKKEDVNADVDVNFDMDLDANEDVDAKVNVRTEELKGKDTQNHLKHISVTCIAVNDISFFQHLVGKNGISVTREIIDFSLSNFQNVDELHKPIVQNSMLNGVFSPYCTINPTMQKCRGDRKNYPIIGNPLNNYDQTFTEAYLKASIDSCILGPIDKIVPKIDENNFKLSIEKIDNFNITNQKLKLIQEDFDSDEDEDGEYDEKASTFH